MWITIGVIAVVILVLVVLRLVKSRPKAMNAEERLEQLGYKYEANPARPPTHRTKGEIKAEIVDGATAHPEPRRKRTIEEIKKDILKEQ